MKRLASGQSSTYAAVCLCLQHLTTSYNKPPNLLSLVACDIALLTTSAYFHSLHFLQINFLHFNVFSKAKVPWQVLVHSLLLHECSEMRSATTSSCETTPVKQHVLGCFRSHQSWPMVPEKVTKNQERSICG